MEGTRRDVMEAMGREQGTRLTGDALEDEIEGMVLLQQINLYGFREGIEMFAILCLFHKIFMESQGSRAEGMVLLHGG